MMQDARSMKLEKETPLDSKHLTGQARCKKLNSYISPIGKRLTSNK